MDLKTLLILGGTGQVGQHLVTRALADRRIERVIAPTRRPLAAHPKLHNPIVDFDRLPHDATWWRADAAVCALGTTRRQAGSATNFYRIDHDYVIAAATLARKAGTEVFVYNSSIGTDVNAGSLYLRTKGEVERDLAALNFRSLTHVRPSLIDADVRPDRRMAEMIAIRAFRLLGGLIPARYRAVTPARIAASMIEYAAAGESGLRIVESEKI